MPSWLTTRALALSVATGALTTGWHYLGRTAALQRAVDAENKAGLAGAQVAVLAGTLETQNAAVAALGEKVAAKQGKVALAQRRIAAAQLASE